MRATPALRLRLLDPRLAGWGFPRRGSALAAGLDLHACLDAPLALEAGGPAVLVGAGFALALPPGHAGLVLPRSGRGHAGLVLGNGAGLIDADYRGELRLSLVNRNAPGAPAIVIAPGERVAQLLVLPVALPALEVVADLGGERDGEGARGAGGFGSSGR